MDQAAEPLSFAGEQGDPDCAVLDPPDPTLQPCARPVDDGSWAARVRVGHPRYLLIVPAAVLER
jgi:hypothetical protein